MQPTKEKEGSDPDCDAKANHYGGMVMLCPALPWAFFCYVVQLVLFSSTRHEEDAEGNRRRAESQQDSAFPVDVKPRSCLYETKVA